MSFQIYNSASLQLQVINSGSVIMDPGGLFVASDWSDATNIHPLSSSAYIYKPNGPIGENYYCYDDIVQPGTTEYVVSPGFGHSPGVASNDNTGSGAGLTYSFWMKSLSTSNHYYNATMAGNNFMIYYGPGYGWSGAGGWIATESGLEFPYDNDWHHYLQTWDSGSKDHYWYIDGKVEYYKANVTPHSSPHFSKLSGIDAAIDEFAFFHKVLIPSDVAPYGKPINLMKKKDEFKLKFYYKCGDGSEQGSGSNFHSLVNGGGAYNTGSLYVNSTGDIGSASANLLKNSGRVVDFNV